jgi:long-subunit acyl-CoA synthetase (AMP-forming)
MDFERLRGATIPGLLVERARTRPAAVAFRAKELGVYREVSWAALAARVAAVAHGLAAAFGVGRDTAVAIIGNPCPEWTIADLAAQALGAVTYGIYPTSAPAEVRYLLEHGGARVVVAEDQESRPGTGTCHGGPSRPKPQPTHEPGSRRRVGSGSSLWSSASCSGHLPKECQP